MPAMSVFVTLCLFGSALPAVPSCETIPASHLGGALLMAMVLVVLVLGHRELTLASLPGPQKRCPCCQRGRVMSPWRFNLLEGAKMMARPGRAVGPSFGAEPRVGRKSR